MLALPALLLTASAADRAEACAPPRCLNAWFLPPDGAEPHTTVPANVGAIFWIPRRPWQPPAVSEGSFSLAEADATPSTPLPITIVALDSDVFLIKPVEALAPHTTYRLVGGDFCDGTGLADETASTRELRTAEAAAIPTTLGTLSVSQPTMGDLSVSTPSGSCGDKISAVQLSVSLDLAPEAEPWKDAFLFRTLVDGEVWGPQHSIKEQLPPGASWTDRGTDRLFHRCAALDPMTDSGLTAGRHRVRMVGELPGLDVSVSTPEVEIELECFDPPDTGVSDAGDSDASLPDEGHEDAGAGDSGADAAVDEPDAGTDAANRPDASVEDELGCGCASAGARAAWWLAPIPFALLRRRAARRPADSA